jgi:predicted DNA-binding transcriptional regulator YafY
MPKRSQHHAISRLLEILKKLPARSPGITARDMMTCLKDAGYDCSKRTVERDLNELAAHFQLICNDKGTPYGWHWMPQAAPDIPALTMADAMSLHLVEESLRPLLPAAILESLKPRFQQARKKMDALGKSNPNVRWFEKVRQVPASLPLLPPNIADGVLETLQEAILENLQIEAAYRRQEAKKNQELRLHPIGLVQRGPVTYLVATAFDYTDARLFAVHRFRKARKLSEPAHKLEGFSLDDYIGEGALHFGNGETIRLVARVSNWLAAILTETPLATDQILKKEGEDFILKAKINDTWQFRWWILSQGDAITVLKPMTLREEISGILRNAVRGYTRRR